MPKILVDADACPKNALQICRKLGEKLEVSVWTVASYNHSIASDHHIVTDSGSQAADLKIINLTDPGDIIITQDWGLAAMALGKPAYCLGPSGREYRPETIDFLMEEREIKAKARRSGGRTKGPAKRTEADDREFEAKLLEILMRAISGAPNQA